MTANLIECYTADEIAALQARCEDRTYWAWVSPDSQSPFAVTDKAAPPSSDGSRLRDRSGDHLAKVRPVADTFVRSGRGLRGPGIAEQLPSR